MMSMVVMSVIKDHKFFSVSKSSATCSEPSSTTDGAKPCAGELSHFYIASSWLCQLSAYDDLIRYVKRHHLLT